jgi:hypothetical protein
MKENLVLISKAVKDIKNFPTGQYTLVILRITGPTERVLCDIIMNIILEILRMAACKVMAFGETNKEISI